MEILKNFWEKAANIKGKIVLPEGEDRRTLIAARKMLDGNLCQVIILGDKNKVQALAAENKISLSGAEIIDPTLSRNLAEYSEFFYEKRKAKGLTPEAAAETVKNNLFFGALMVKFGEVNGMVAGAANTTADVLKAALQVVGVKKGLKTVSSCFIMVVPDYMGEDKVYLFGDCAVVPAPTAEQLADIAVSTAETRIKLLGDEPKVAMLSFSTKGSAEHELVDKVRSAVQIMREKEVAFAYDGELQLDAAIVPQVAASKAPASKVAGQANTLIFPDLQAGNIGYKLVQRFAKAEAIGPVIQGLAAPICDLSRGCSADDIANTAALVLLMSV